jgi:protein-disulfide isomerase
MEETQKDNKEEITLEIPEEKQEVVTPEVPKAVVLKAPNPYLIPLAIVLGFGLVAGAIFYVGSKSVVAPTVLTGTNQPPAEVADKTGAVRPVSSEDHIKGNPDAPIKIVEYSDFECPFCKRFHDTMNEVIDKYGASGEVAWVFRQFPLDQLHPVKARAVAVASECAAELGGNDAFWKFTDGYFDVTLTNNQTNTEVVIPQLAKAAGLNQTAFQTCFESGKHDSSIEADIANAVETGGRGTPWSIMIGPDGKTYPINGALPLAAIEQLINIAKKK